MFICVYMFEAKRFRAAIISKVQILWAKYLMSNFKTRFNEFLNFQISSLVGFFKKINAFLVFSICFPKTVLNK